MTIKSKASNDLYREQYDWIFKKYEPTKIDRKNFEYPPICEEPDKPDTYKQDQKH